ncbi:MAG TPA: NAD(P)H-quinone oxidoreductase [Byssovorax sp.]|jgi:putative PIG3 family NAD(P)H quinone oxidoreductase
MRAVVITNPGELELRDVAEPAPPFAHVRVRVEFAGVNRADLLQKMGLYPAPKGVPADIPGMEYAGVVDALGDGVTSLAVGDRVHGLVGGGAYAEKIVAHERVVVKVPDALSSEHAAAVPEAYVTALDALVARGRAQAGDSVLIHAAGSGVGVAAVQLAARLGCRVIGTSRTPDKLERCKEHGLDVGIVPKGSEFAAAVKQATSGRGADVIVDLVGGAYMSENVHAAATRGRIVVVGLTAGASAEIDLRFLLSKRVEMIGTTLRARPLEEKIEAANLLARRIDPLFAPRCGLAAVIEAVLPLAEAARAHDLVAANATFGKVLLDCR